MSETQTIDNAAGAAPTVADELGQILETHAAPDTNAAAPATPAAAPAPAAGTPATPAPAPAPPAANDPDAELTSILLAHLSPPTPAASAPAPAPAAPKATETPAPADAPPPPPANATKGDLADYAKRMREDGYEAIADGFEALAARIPKGTDPADVKKLVAEELQAQREAAAAEDYFRKVHSILDDAVGTDSQLRAILGHGDNRNEAQLKARKIVHDIGVKFLQAVTSAKAKDPTKDISKFTGPVILQRAVREYAKLQGIKVADPAAPAPAAPTPARDTSGRFAPNPPKNPAELTPAQRDEQARAESERVRASAVADIGDIMKKRAGT